jgi:hypothetical protein
MISKENLKKIVEFNNLRCGLMIESIFKKVEEPTVKNRIIMDEKVAHYDKIRPLIKLNCCFL